MKTTQASRARRIDPEGEANDCWGVEQNQLSTNIFKFIFGMKQTEGQDKERRAKQYPSFGHDNLLNLCLR